MNVFRFRSGSSATASVKSAAPSTKSATPSVNYGPITHEPILTPPKECNIVLAPPLDDEQKQKIKEMMEYIDSVILPKDDPYHERERGFLSEGTARRYLVARKWNFEAARKMLEDTINWRREFRPDELDADSIRPEAETGKMYFSGFDKAGRPLWIMKPRNENSKDSERQVKHIVFCLERGIRLMPENVGKISIVIDFKDSSMSSNPSFNTSRKFLNILSNHYPERLGVAFMINSPWFFMTTFKAVSALMDPVTREKIRFINTDDTKEADNGYSNLEDYIPLSQMEVELGGKYNFVFDISTYWSNLLKVTGEPFNAIEYK